MKGLFLVAAALFLVFWIGLVSAAGCTYGNWPCVEHGVCSGKWDFADNTGQNQFNDTKCANNQSNTACYQYTIKYRLRTSPERRGNCEITATGSSNCTGYLCSLFCGDGACNNGENSSNCCADCGCPAGKTCYNSACCTPSWGACSATCGGGTQSDGCGGSQPCNTQACACTGPIDSNAVIYSGDNTGTIPAGEVTNILVSQNTPRKCEWACKSGFVKGAGADANKCLAVQRFCQGPMDSNAVLISSDENLGLGPSDLNTNVLVDANTLRKCEWICGPGFARGAGADANKCLLLRPVEPQPCGGATPFGDGVILGAATYTGGEPTSWTFDSMTDQNVTQCSWKCGEKYAQSGGLCIPSAEPDYNSIKHLSAEIRDGNFFVGVSCSNMLLPVIFSISSMATSYTEFEAYSLSGAALGNQQTKLDCGTAPATYLISTAAPIAEKETYYITATIDSPCKICSKQVFVYYGGAGQPSAAPIPDNSVFFAAGILLIAAVFIARKRI